MVFGRYKVANIIKKTCILYLITLMSGYAVLANILSVRALSLDPAYENSTGYETVSWCGGGYGDYRTYCRRNCTSYVAYRLAATGVSSAHYTHNGNGKDWDDNARAKGIPTGTTPKVGAVAYWNSGGGGYGHVGWVESINTNNSVNTSNYNGLTGEFYTQTAVFPEGYIYFSNTTTVAAGVGSAQFLGTDILGSGTRLSPNQYILSGDVKNVLILQKDGNLVVYGPGYRPIWNTKTNGDSISSLVMQGDGNLVLYRTNGSVAWNSQTQGNPGAKLVMQGDGNLVIYSTTGRALWNSGTLVGNSPQYLNTNKMLSGQSMYMNQYIRSTDKRYALVLQTDGNLVLYAPGYKALWNSGTINVGSHRVVTQPDGNLVIYNSLGKALWNTGKFATNPYLAIQNDGNTVMYGSNGAYWNTGTNGKL